MYRPAGDWAGGRRRWRASMGDVICGGGSPARVWFEEKMEERAVRPATTAAPLLDTPSRPPSPLHLPPELGTGRCAARRSVDARTASKRDLPALPAAWKPHAWCGTGAAAVRPPVLLATLGRWGRSRFDRLLGHSRMPCERGEGAFWPPSLDHARCRQLVARCRVVGVHAAALVWFWDLAGGPKRVQSCACRRCGAAWRLPINV